MSETRACLECGTPFPVTTKHPAKKLCSESCRRDRLRRTNQRLAQMTAEQRGNTLRNKKRGGEKKQYRKFHGKLLHRQIEEVKLGRELAPGEIVHHISHDHTDDRPENLQALESRSDHLREHLIGMTERSLEARGKTPQRRAKRWHP